MTDARPEKRREPFGPRLCYSHPNASSAAAAAWRLTLPAGARGFVGLPVLSGDLGVSVDGALRGSQQGKGGEARLGSEGAGAGGLGVEAVDAVAVLVAILVGEVGCEVAGLCDLAAVEGGAAVGGPDEGADDALEVDAHGRVVHGGLQCLGGKADLLFGGLPDAVVIHGVEAVGGSDLLGLDGGGGEPDDEFEGDCLAGLGARAGFEADF